jgi:hypothetical protein
MTVLSVLHAAGRRRLEVIERWLGADAPVKPDAIAEAGSPDRAHRQARSQPGGNCLYVERLAVVSHHGARSASLTCHRRAERQDGSRRAVARRWCPLDCRNSAAGSSAAAAST